LSFFKRLKKRTSFYLSIWNNIYLIWVYKIFSIKCIYCIPTYHSSIIRAVFSPSYGGVFWLKLCIR